MCLEVPFEHVEVEAKCGRKKSQSVQATCCSGEKDKKSGRCFPKETLREGLTREALYLCPSSIWNKQQFLGDSLEQVL